MAVSFPGGRWTAVVAVSAWAGIATSVRISERQARSAWEGAAWAQGAGLLPDVADRVFDQAHFHYRIASRTDIDRMSLWGPHRFHRTLAHESEIEGVRFFPKGDRVLTFGKDPVVTIWDVVDGKKLVELPHSGSVECADVFPDGGRVVTCAGESTRMVWNATTGEKLHTLVPPTYHGPDRRFGFITRGVSMFPDGGRVLGWGFEQWATIWDTSTGRGICELRRHTAPISSAAVFPGGDKVITGGFDRKAVVWDSRTCEVLHEIADVSWMLEVAVLSSGDLVATMSSNGRVTVWDAASGERLHELVDPDLPGKGMASGMKAFPTQDRIATFSMGVVVLWDAALGKVLRVLEVQDPVYSCAMSSNGYLLAVCGREEVSVWDLASGSMLQSHRTSSLSRPPNVCPIDIGPA